MAPQSAFVSSFAPAALHSAAFAGRAVSPARPASAATRMAVEAPEKPKTSSFSRLEANRSAKIDSEYRGPQGFTPYAEKVNGRLAQLGFVIGLVTEIVSGKPIGQQMLIMFSPLTHALTALFGAIGN